MFIAIGFPSSAREEGAVVLYAGLDKGRMLAACDDAAKSEKFERIGKLIRPVFQRHAIEAAVLVKVDCSAAHNAGLSAERAALAAGIDPEAAAIKGAGVKADAAKALARRLQDLIEPEQKKFAAIKAECEKQIALAPMQPKVKEHFDGVLARAQAALDKVVKDAAEATEASDLAAKDLAAKEEALAASAETSPDEQGGDPAKPKKKKKTV